MRSSYPKPSSRHETTATQPTTGLKSTSHPVCVAQTILLKVSVCLFIVAEQVAGEPSLACDSDTQPATLWIAYSGLPSELQRLMVFPSASP